MPSPPPPRRSHLADGREILYFDDAASASRPPRDPRPLEPRAAPAELRTDRLVDEPVIVATHRQERTFLPSDADCPLCPSRDGRQTEIPAAGYDVVVFENRFPSLPAAQGGSEPTGRSEVIVYASDHDADFATLPSQRLRTIAAAWASRVAELSALPGVANLLCFENRGVEIGVTLRHPHGQIYAYPFVPPRIARMAHAARRHRDTTGACLGCELLAEEVAAHDRVVVETDGAVAYVPEAARWPFEIHLVPRRHVGSLADLTDAERDELVEIQADLLGRLDRLFDAPAPYMAGWLASPLDEPDLLHLRLQAVTPIRAPGKLKYLAGSESLAGAFINDIRPEEAAERLRATAS